MVFHNGSTYDFHIIKQLAKGFHGQLECLRENTEKYITFSVFIKKELYNCKTITHKLTLVDNLSEISGCKEKIIKSVCDFIVFKNNKLHCKSKECKNDI